MIRNFSRAFTLIELLIVIAVIAILATIAYPTYIGIQERAKVTKDLNNLRQIGIGTQLYMNDNDGALPGSTTVAWMSQLNPKYLPSWNVFQSPFDTRPPSEVGIAGSGSPISYGINANIYPPPNNTAISADKISKPSIFILFAPAQDSAPTTVEFQGIAGTGGTAGPSVTVLGIGGTNPPRATSTPGGNAIGGTHSSRGKINALFADLHLENMTWSVFANNANTPSDPSAAQRWSP
jgi:prepilin-type N-terminal cleavage/methylation domain-containing protein